jgi:hypothetical protein
MRSIHALSAAMGLLCLFLSGAFGCANFQHPLVEPAKAKQEPSLYGAYRFDKLGEEDWEEAKAIHFAHIGKAPKGFPDGFVQLVVISHPEKSHNVMGEARLIGFVEPLGEHYILHIPLHADEKEIERTNSNWSIPWDEAKVTGYAMARITKSKDGLVFAGFDPKFLEDRIKEGKLKGEIREEHAKALHGLLDLKLTSPTVTAEAKELRAFIEANLESKLFQPSQRAVRIP